MALTKLYRLFNKDRQLPRDRSIGSNERGGAEECPHKPQNCTMASMHFLSLPLPCLCLYFNKVVVHLCWDRQAAGQLGAYTLIH